MILKMLSLALLIIFNFYGYAQPIQSLELINNAKQYDNKIVQYQGEVIGGKMERGDFAWLNVNDEYIAIGTWTKNELTKEIEYFGNYSTKGDIVLITGVFHRACPEHGGDLDIHALSIKIINSGNPQVTGLNYKKLYLGLFLSILLLFGIKIHHRF